MKNKYVLIIAVAVFILGGFLGARFLFLKSKEEQSLLITHTHAESFIRDYSYRIGSDSAKVKLIEFMDPECESCRAMHPEVKKILAEYKEDIQLIIRYAPFHGNSKFVISILEAARKQDKYEQVLDILFEYQLAWGDHHHPRPELVWTYLMTIEGLDVERIRRDMNASEVVDIINKDIEDGRKLEVKATPTFFVNGRPLVRFGLSYLKDLIKEEHSK